MLGEQIRKSRLALGLSQEALAFEANVSRNYVSLLELNQKSPTVDTLLRTCEAMDVSAADLIREVERERKATHPPFMWARHGPYGWCGRY